MTVWLRSKANLATYRYLAVGLGVYLIELCVIFIAQASGGSDLFAVGLSFWIGLIVSFILQKFVTFRDSRTQSKIVLFQIAAVVALVLFNFAFTLICTSLLASVLPVFIIRGGAIAVTTMWNFYLYKSRIFRGQKLLPIE